MDDATKKRIRKEYRPQARDHIQRKGLQAVVEHENRETGEVRIVFAGEHEHATSRDAIAAAKVWIEAEIGRRERVAMLADRRKEALPVILHRNALRLDDIKAEAKNLSKQKAEIEAENRMLIDEVVDPVVEINLYEATQTYTYTVTERGRKVDVDDRQMGLFQDGVTEEPTDGVAPTIQDLANDDGTAWPE